MESESTHPLTEDRDEQLAALLNNLLESGPDANIDAIALQYPDLADELRELWAVTQFAHAMSNGRVTAPTTPDDFTPSPMPRSFGDYEILEILGRGGMGVVYKARQRSLGRLVALKMVRDPDLASPDERARFRGEAEAVARLNHPNIVTVHEVGEFEGQAYFCMEYIPGQTLAQRLQERSIPIADLARMLARIARAVHHAHQLGILHRDLKPSNILLSGPGLEEPIVTDFGVAKRLPGTQTATPAWRTQTGAIVGTPAYMPPEQVGSRAVGPASDVYSLGAILYECVTGQPPFRAESPVDVLLMVIDREPVPPRFLNPKVPRDLEMICLKCLQKPTDLRYPSAEALAEDLEAFANGETIAAQPSGFLYLLDRMMRPTHHAPVLENWGLLWIWHSLALFLLCLATQVMEWTGLGSHPAYLVLWTVGLCAWGAIMWRIRRRAGPVLFVERQLAHAWAAGVGASVTMFLIEVAGGMEPLTLSPAIAVAAAMVFVFKAGILSGEFYFYAGLLFLTAALTPFVSEFGVLLFGIVSAFSFFIPGVKYYRLRRRSEVRAIDEATHTS